MFSVNVESELSKQRNVYKSSPKQNKFYYKITLESLGKNWFKQTGSRKAEQNLRILRLIC
jgi:hypothetical protein